MSPLNGIADFSIMKNQTNTNTMDSTMIKPKSFKQLLVCDGFPIAIAGGLLLLLLLMLFGLAGCASAPSSLERHYYDVATNYTPVVTVVTNQTPAGPVVSLVTNQVVSGYNYTPNTNAQAVKETGGVIGNLFGVGGLVGTAIGALFSLYGYVRSSKNLTTAATLAQNIEMIRQFIKQLPNGSQYDQVLTTFMQQHQAEEGVLNQVLDLLKNEISNPDANAAVMQIQATLAALNQSPPAPVPPVIPAKG